MDGKKEREAVLTEMGHEAERKGLARRQGWPRGDKKGRRRPPRQGRMNGGMDGEISACKKRILLEFRQNEC